MPRKTPAPGRRDRRSIRLADIEWQAFQAMGGTKWLTAVLEPTVKRLTIDTQQAQA